MKREPALSWALTWIGILFFYFWPFAVLHGSARMAVGIPWLVLAVVGSLWIRHLRVRPRPDWAAHYEDIDRQRRSGYQ